jgi:Fuc2NAc and GlcNAc transferase
VTNLLLLLTILAAATVGTGAIRRIAIARNMMDVPNARSSHVLPTPRGGGVAIVVAFLGGVVVAWMLNLVEAHLTVAVVGSGALVAAVGLADDRYGLPAVPRLIVHTVAAAWAVYWLGGLPPVTVLWHTANFGIAGDVLAVLALVWLLNLYNFMDGIDGIAGVECVTVCAGAATLTLLPLDARAPMLGPAMLGASALGFLFWNVPPARIFMGDAGSGFLGITLGVLALDATRQSPQAIWSWLILLLVFVVDASVTLVRRVTRGARPHEAHRTHAYQYAARRHRGHRPVIVAVGIVNLVWLLPIALAVRAYMLDGVVACILASAPLIWLAYRYDAGIPESRP